MLLRTRARAKINLTLHVVGRRADGYHDLESIVVFAGVHDELTFEAAADWSLLAKGPKAAFCGPADDNLVLKAARYLQSLLPHIQPGRFSLLKRLPAQAGIGGGSADAAAALRLLAEANGLSLDHPAVLSAAVKSGADVTVCLRSTAQMMLGLGERAAPLDGLPRLNAVLATPDAKVETKAAFARFGLQPGEVRSGAEHPVFDPDHVIEGLRLGRNDFEPIAIETAPAVAQALAALRNQPGCQLARMSGSGSTCFGLFDDCHAAARAARGLRTDWPGWWIVPTLLR
jgi:4-diphosphocytidyl-2-C-methyl-D-erythritol kinase